MVIAERTAETSPVSRLFSGARISVDATLDAAGDTDV